MYPLLLPIAFAISLIIMLSIVIFSILKSIKRAPRPPSMQWLKQHGKRVMATVLQVTAEGEWKYGGRFSRWNAWEGRYRTSYLFLRKIGVSCQFISFSKA